MISTFSFSDWINMGSNHSMIYLINDYAAYIQPIVFLLFIDRWIKQPQRSWTDLMKAPPSDELLTGEQATDEQQPGMA